MPYIDIDDRRRAVHAPETPGELNFALCMLATDYFSNSMDAPTFFVAARVLCEDYLEFKGLSYENANAVMGALYCAGKELRRRILEGSSVDTVVKKLDSVREVIYDGVVAPYEDTKVLANGDVFPAELCRYVPEPEVQTERPAEETGLADNESRSTEDGE